MYIPRVNASHFCGCPYLCSCGPISSLPLAPVPHCHEAAERGCCLSEGMSNAVSSEAWEQDPTLSEAGVAMLAFCSELILSRAPPHEPGSHKPHVYHPTAVHGESPALNQPQGLLVKGAAGCVWSP